MKFTIEDIEKLSEDIKNGDTEEIPLVELCSVPDFLKFFVAMGAYIISISKSLESINNRLSNIEYVLTDENQFGRA